ncbi:MAG: 2OG-Fe(II) oxygenase [Minwuia sp.]|nr:2OG-Fe(II) oxygenase [Minwuia sp.]
MATPSQHLQPGDPAPDFTAPSTVNPSFHFNTIGGHRAVLVFLNGGERAGVRRVLADTLGGFRSKGIHVFGVVHGPDASMDARQDGIDLPITLFRDADGAIARKFRMVTARDGDTPPRLLNGAYVIDESVRVVGFQALAPTGTLVDRLHGMLDQIPPRAPSQVIGGQAPVLVVPNVIPVEFCKRLIDYYKTTGGSASGFMREVDGRTVGIMDSRFKRRSDCIIEDTALRAEVREAINRRLCPLIFRAFNFNATRLERYLVACYDEQAGGFFRAHRDNTTKGTAHRRFAVTINLNAEEYDGGELRFPEYVDHRYRAPTGGAVVFGCGVLHEALPVTRGTRYALLPFLFDEDAERLRSANLSFLDNDRVIDLNDPAPVAQ